MRRTLNTLGLLMLMIATGFPAVVVNEVLVNEPGSNSALEWFELYNNSNARANLAFLDFLVGDNAGEDSFFATGDIPAWGFAVFCADSVQFESYYGDNSGVWGDASPLEDYSLFELPFNLVNEAGYVRILSTLDSSLISELVWPGAGADGISWERYHPDSPDIMSALDPPGSTPGYMNSVSPLPIDLALESATAWVDNGQTLVAFEIANVGLTPVTNGILELYFYDESRPDSLGDLIAGEPIGEVDSGGTVILIGQYDLSGFYEDLVGQVLLFDDDQVDNNRIHFTAPGGLYPPLILSEFLANPTGSGSEWVELKNVSNDDVDLNGWSLADSLGEAVITTTETLVLPGSYFVIVQDAVAFMGQYPSFSGRSLQADGWRVLNNGSDSLRLSDNFGIVADHTYYSEAHSDDHTWSRAEAGEREGDWGRSENPGGSPGRPNQVRFTPEGSQTLNLTTEPRIISPDGDGIDDSTVITINSSPASAYTLKLFDRQGRLVRTLEDGGVDLRESYVWDGKGSGGERLPIGIYIIYFEAAGVESIKKTLVVAR